MKVSNPILIFLTCANEQEAVLIADKLLDLHLVACIKRQLLVSQFLWQGQKKTSPEILLLMETVLEKFDQIATEVKKLHSYDMPVLQAVPVVKMSESADDWLRTELQL